MIEFKNIYKTFNEKEIYIFPTEEVLKATKSFFLKKNKSIVLVKKHK